MEENNQQKAKVYIMADTDCEVYIFANHICSIKAGESKELYMLKGNKKIEAVSVVNPADKIELIYSVTDTDIEDFIELKFKEVRRKKELKNTIVTTAKKSLKILMWILLISFLLLVFILFFNNKSENTPQSKNKITENGHEYVDLGLSVKWATCNVGAKSPEDYGDYFAWGETETKDYYDWDSYKYCYGSEDTMIKYCTSSSYGRVDNKTELELSDDAAHVNWGGNWRMPTKAEQDELIEKCSWVWTTLNGVNGYKVISRKNGNSIFLPAAGCRLGSHLYGAGSYGYYWSSSLCTSRSDRAYNLFFYSSGVDWYGYYRYSGHSVRPVCE